MYDPLTVQFAQATGNWQCQLAELIWPEDVIGIPAADTGSIDKDIVAHTYETRSISIFNHLHNGNREVL